MVSSNKLDEKKMKKSIRAFKTLRIILKVVVYTFLILWAIVVLFPFYFMVITSFKDFATYAYTSTEIYITYPTFDNYISAWVDVDMIGYLMNTLVFALVTTSIMLVVSILAAFAFARLEFRGKNLVFTLFLAMMMIPNELVIITNFVTITNSGLTNSYTGLILPSVLSVFYIYLLRQNFMQVPDSLYYAAKVDGLSDMNYLIKVLIPLSKPTIITIIILKLIECWNSYVWPRLITSEVEGQKSYFLVSNAIEAMRNSGFGKSNMPAMMSAVVIVSIPLLLLFAIFRNQIMSGVVRTGTKG
ncbi:multiple sugar transport system permease protein [Anaeroplasma bactoclasticum]|jgi:multiple sugar transport system permease protein|uniref:Multiple sugar transport system permease protein n=1 Tax=Anaeroplasma bactoclasticum TaxID=2088 RepID=A0A397RWS0_9MOLU|nr:carbohydrate ABC transporter permease [Anaeroplasma bactoclasticum]RIA78198.1 multiple sugar transport system permease protein [Anaeroplasma bactoclasticum]